MTRTLFIALTLGLFFQTIASPLRAKELPGKVPIWTLKGEHATIFLAGSVHLLREKDLPIPDGFDDVYEQSGKVVFELDMADMMNPATMKKIQENGLLAGSDTIENFFDETTVASIRTYLSDLGVPENAFDRMKPGTLFITLTSLAATKQGARSDLGLEMQYYRKAMNDGKPTGGLETIDYQMSLFHKIDLETIQRLITEMINEQDKSTEALDEVIAAWKSGDPKQIEEIIVAELAEEEQVKNLLLVQRNKNWIAPIEEALNGKENVMFLVGAAHLAGEDSVIDLLEKKGYTPIQFSPALSRP